MQYETLTAVNASSNEHQILRDIFSDPYAISTVKLLQLAHLEHKKQGNDQEGFLMLTSESLKALNTTPAIAHTLYFSHLKELKLHQVKQASLHPSWKILKSLLHQNEPLKAWSYAYMTPGFISSQNGKYHEIGVLILTPFTQYALISNNNLFFHGGLGSPLPSSYFIPHSIRNWELTSSYNLFGFNNYSLKIPSKPSGSSQSNPSLSTQIKKPSSDIRPENKSWLSYVADPVDTITGAFYIDEIDLTLPGSFPLEIRRNYNSQNPLHGNLGFGWKLSLNPFLIEQSEKLFAAEEDGTVICYRYNHATSCYEVTPEDNPDLYNFNKRGMGSNLTLFHSYIKDNILYGADGSKRFFEKGRLTKWINCKGATLTFFYDKQHLSRIESSNGDFLGFHHNPQGNIVEIYTKDGRRLAYHYNTQEDLVKVTLPNTAEISYEYDHHHRLIRESKPHGKILENIYDDKGRVIEQRSPMGPAQEMIATATFKYTDNTTTVIDACQGTTLYKIFDKQIYQVIDPLGNMTFQSWFIDQASYFDGKTEKILCWEGLGSFPRSLKSTTDKRGLTTSYLYDDRGNPIEIILQGEDLTGKGDTLIKKKLCYNDHNLCIQEEILDQKTTTFYDENFPYLPKKIEKYSYDTLTSYTEFSYNALAQRVQENHNGSIILWQYNARGYPIQKIEKTGTEDPDVITTYTYNLQGQCLKMTCVDHVQKNAYDIMGNLIQSEHFSPSGHLLSAIYIGYNLNNQPIWRQTAHLENTLYFDYHASLKIKATKQTLMPSKQNAYTIYEYDPRGYLIEEINPLGITTYREYDPLGHILCETKENHTTHRTYEPGGLVETITSPSGATTTFRYTTNGLPIEVIYPDTTKALTIYDFFGRKVQETKRGITWNMTYNDAKHSLTRTHQATGLTEIETYDAHGNLICFQDRSGYLTKKTYDGLGRIKSETSPTGQKTTWNYLGNSVLCTLPSGEIQENRYEGNRLIESKILGPDGHLIAHTTFHYNPENDSETITQDTQVTTTWMNTFKLPIKVQKGAIITTYEYDKLGNCITLTDGEGKVTRQTFDGLSRLIQKELPDGAPLKFSYDLDSNLTHCHLPNGNIWQASYDAMGRKLSEKLTAGREICHQWDYFYQEGHLKKAKDGMGHITTYSYDSHGRLVHEKVAKWERTYAYDPRGLLTFAEQKRAQSPSNAHHSQIKRTYNEEGLLTLELIYLDSQLLQETHQRWTPSSRTLQIKEHQREMHYQNHRLSHIATDNIHLSYTYETNGKLKSKTGPYLQTLIDHNPSGLPKTLSTEILGETYQETLTWNPSGKLATYLSPKKDQHFTYTLRGHLKSSASETYEFDFGNLGMGTLTQTPSWQALHLDSFGRVLEEFQHPPSLINHYNAMGETTSHGEKDLTWDPWGRLLKVSEPTSTWEAFYDALGRRLQTRYTPTGNATLVTTSFYDPEKEFQEIGIKYGDITYWKIFGPTTCEAITNENKETVFLGYDALNQLLFLMTDEKVHHLPQTCSSYGPQENPPLPTDLITYAASLLWHSKRLDPTGLILMGQRYYDPKGGRFISPDPISFPLCLNLYAYAGGDPINYFDPDGRFASNIYQTSKPTLLAGLDSLTGYRQKIKAFNRTSSFCLDHHLTCSEPYQVGLLDLPNGAINFNNGINNTKEASMKKAHQLSQLAGGAKIYGIYNATNGPIVDIIECGLGHFGCMTPPTLLLKARWNYFINMYGPKAKFFQPCHSGGADHVKNALLSSPKSTQQQIIVLAIAPSVIIPEEICFRSYNYISARDFVTHLDLVGKLKYGDQLRILIPHPEANFWDHDFLSPTFIPLIQYHINEYIENYGGNR